MRILLLTNRVPYPLHDGGALAMAAMIRGYKRLGKEVFLLAMNTSRHHVEDILLERLYSDLDGFEAVAVENDLKPLSILKNLLFSSEPEHASRFRSALFEERLQHLLQSIKPDVVQLESPFLASCIPLIRAASSALIVYRMHNIEGQIWQRLAEEASGLKRLYLRNLEIRMKRYEARLWRDADLLLPITKGDAAVVKADGCATPMVISPFGISMNAEALLHPDGPFKVYHLGAMDWLPNKEAVRWFIDSAWPVLHQMSPDITAHFAGRAMPESFRQNLPAGVFCKGEVADAQLFIADKHALIVPLRAGSGIRVKTLEAMAAGRLVISTGVGLQGIDATANVHYLRAETAQDFAECITWASKNGEQAEVIIRAAKNLVQTDYNQDTIMERVINGIATLLAKQRPIL